MTDEPVKDWFTESPVSKIEYDFLACSDDWRESVFLKDKQSRQISTPETDVKIFYTMDGSEPNEKSMNLRKTFHDYKTAIIKAIAINSKGEKSLVAESKFNKMPNDWDGEISFNLQSAIHWRRRERFDWRSSRDDEFRFGRMAGLSRSGFCRRHWSKRETEIKKLGGGFLQVARTWIWMPTQVEFEVSNDGENFTKVADIKTDVAVEDMKRRSRIICRKSSPIKRVMFELKPKFGQNSRVASGRGFWGFYFCGWDFYRIILCYNRQWRGRKFCDGKNKRHNQKRLSFAPR